MNILVVLIPAALFLGLLALLGFFWALRHNQFDDPSGQAARVLSDRYDDHPAEDAALRAAPSPPGPPPPRNPLDAPPGNS